MDYVALYCRICGKVTKQYFFDITFCGRRYKCTVCEDTNYDGDDKAILLPKPPVKKKRI